MTAGSPRDEADDAQRRAGPDGPFVADRSVDVTSPRLGAQRLAYYDNGADAPAIVFVHPNSCSTVAWERQLAAFHPDGSTNPLARDFRLLAFDFPGHGRTARLSSGTNDYSLPFYADALAAFSRSLGLERAIYVGHSLGGHAVMEAGGSLQNPAGALVFGAPPVSTHEQLGAAFFPMPGGPHFLTGELSRADVCHWEAAVFYSEIPAWFARLVAHTDSNARSGLAASLGTLADEVGMVKGYPCPFALVHGAYERAVRLAYLESLGLEASLWRGAVQVVPESNHFTQFDQPAAFNELVAAFARDVLARA